MSTSILLSTSSHLLSDALCTASQSHSGISVSAFEHAWLTLMNDTPKRASTAWEVAFEGKENPRSAPAWMGDGEDVPEKERLLVFGDMVMVVGLEVETDLYVPEEIRVCWWAVVGGLKS